MKARNLTKETIINYGVVDRGFPAFKVGDTVEVAQIVKEGDKERTQLFLGDVLDIHNNGIASTFTVRRLGANNVGVERIFPFHAPVVQGIRLVKEGRVRRANLGYIRERLGKAARIQEKVLTKAQKEAKKQKEVQPTVESDAE